MKKTKEMFAGGFYLLQGQSSANSTFIEDKEEAFRFIGECNKRLSGFAKVHDYVLTKDGWVLLISLLDEETIKKNYKNQWKKSLKVKKKSFLTEVWKIISEKVRQIRFTFVLYSNRKNGREGSKVKKSYERYWFESAEEAQSYIDKMKKQMIKLVQKRKTYRSKQSHFRITKSDQKGAIFLCSLNVEPGAESKYFREGCLELINRKSDVLRKLVRLTICLHISSKTKRFQAKIE